MPFPFDATWLYDHSLAHFHSWSSSGPQDHDHDHVDMSLGLGLPLHGSGSAKAAAFLQGPHDQSWHALGSQSDTQSDQGFSAAAWPREISARHGTSFLFDKETMSNVVGAMKATPPVALIPLHAASIVFSLPGHIAFELGEGYLFGFQKGLELAFVGKAVGALAAFGVGRSVGCCQELRESLRQRMESWPVATKAAKSVEQGGHASVFLVRIAPLPCVVKNYALSLLTDIPWSIFVPGTLLGLLPTTAAHVYAGTLAPTSAELMSGQGAAMKVVAAATTMGGVAFLGLLAAYCLQRRLTEKHEDEEELEKELPQVVARPGQQKDVETVKLFRPQKPSDAMAVRADRKSVV